ncbi:MAG: group II intron reverse transcriptase/maturase [Spirochaetia bacterium]|nr:group II intron reverse transcriptase/maturase [Spirochaetia bacterium]
MDLVLSSENMHKAWKQVKRNGGSPGIDGMTIDTFPDYLRKRWNKIKQALLLGYYVPAPVLRVEIPKKSGGWSQTSLLLAHATVGKRMLGIPTVQDRVIQQAISQVLNPIFDPEFSEYSYGFRPGRSAHGAVRQVNTYVKSGYKYAVDLDLEKFFDTVNHDILMNLVARKIKDKTVLKLIGRYLRAGIRDREGNTIPTSIGTPQGGPLSPLLSNILLDQFDRELERRNLRFARYADDAIILVSRLCDGKTILSEITMFLDRKLKLVVNHKKSKVAKVAECNFLGFTFKGKKIRWTESSFQEFHYQLKYLTRRSWGVSMEYRFQKLNQYIRGWMNYYGISQYYSPVQNIDDWLRRRIRMCYWKQWRYPRTKVRKLMELGVPRDFAIMTGASSKSYWHLSKTLQANAGMSNKWLEKQGLINIKAQWCKAQGYS